MATVNAGWITAGEYMEGHSLFVAMLPQMEQHALYNALKLSININMAANLTIQRTQINTLMCPSDAAEWQIDQPDEWNTDSPERLPGGLRQLFGLHRDVVSRGGESIVLAIAGDPVRPGQQDLLREQPDTIRRCH